MKDYLVKDPWKVIEEKFYPEYNPITESIMSIGNGYMGQRANFEETYSGKSMQGSYLAGIYYPDKTRVGWWKNGYPEYFAKVLNSVNWIGIDIYIGDEKLDLAKVKLEKFRRVLDMEHSIISKNIVLLSHDGIRLRIDSERFCSRSTKELGCIKYCIESDNYEGPLRIESYLDFDVHNEDSNYDEQFWEHSDEGHDNDCFYVQAFTKKTKFEVHASGNNTLEYDGSFQSELYSEAKKSGQRYTIELKKGNKVKLIKRVIIVSSFYHDRSELANAAGRLHDGLINESYKSLRDAHTNAWLELWRDSDIQIEGDVSAQQGIRFNIFHLHQTYSGEDARLNIGPKGFTGEKYGGSTYWDTEAYCIPFYLANSDERVSRNLLMYRYKHLEKAIENAAKLGFDGGAALYPMVTMNGEECHNEWEITFEEIHRNGAIAYAIFDYTQYTGDDSYLLEYGIDVLVGIARFWAQRVNWSEYKQQYVMLGVTGPNEYENNVNNNWYTNYLAVWCLKYTASTLVLLAERSPENHRKKCEALNLDPSELVQWKKIVAEMYYPFDKKRNIFLQQDGFLDKEFIPVSELDTDQRPLNQNWSWDRILRSCYIKQADVLQGIYFFESDFDSALIKRHFDFYEPLTVHESSLSPCVHAILACRIAYYEKASEMYLRTARLDLDDYNNDTEDGLHITSMAGTWMSVVKGFAGMKIVENRLSFEPYIPKNWVSYSFTIRFRGRHIRVNISDSEIVLENLAGDSLEVLIAGVTQHLPASEQIRLTQT